MLELIVFIKCSGDNARADNLYDTISSFKSTNQDVKYKIYLVVDSHLLQDAHDIFKNISIEDKILSYGYTTNVGDIRDNSHQ